MRLFTIVFVVGIVASGQMPAVLSPQMGAVLPDDQALTFARPRLCNRPGAGPADGTWRPEPETIRRLESVLGAELQTALDLQSDPNRRLLATDFYRQYAGLVIAGRRVVYISGLHRSHVDREPKWSWQTQAARGCDGGLRSFGAEYDVATRVVSNILFDGGGRGARPWGSGTYRGEAVPPTLATLLYGTPYEGRMNAWCRASLGGGKPDAFAVALVSAQGTRYAVVFDDRRIVTLADVSGRSDLTCYSRADAEKLNATIRSSATIDRSVTPKWGSTVICGFVRDTEAVCWQYSSQEKKFVRIGGWVT